MSSPIKISFKTELIPLFLVFVSILSSLYFYKNFPDLVPIHWNMAGEADSWGSPFKSAFMFPVLNIGIYLLFLIIPYMDPKKERYEQFASTYHIFKTAIILFLSLIYFTASFSALGYDINITRVVTTFVGALFVVIGNYMSKIKQNWFLGIRTPWTLSSEEVWNKTHRLGGKMFLLSGLLMMSISYFDIKYRIAIVVTILLLSVLVSPLYSFYLYNKEEKEKHGN